MGTWMPKVVVALEDRRFFHHPGADLTSLSRAMVQNMRAEGYIRWLNDNYSADKTFCPQGKDT